MKERDFILFLQYCLDENKPLPENIKDFDWKEVITWAERQAIIGVVFEGIERAGKALDMPFNILARWIGYAQQIEMQNRIVNKRCVELTEQLRNEGFDCCILKGQGNAVMYPNPLLRNPGDIDLLVLGHTDLTDSTDRETNTNLTNDTNKEKSDSKLIKETIRYVRRKNPGAKACYHHVDYGDFNGVEVELHYRPSYIFNPLHNYRLQRWLSKMADDGWMMAELPENAGTIRVPNWEFNIVFQLSHVYNHLLHEGIGLRQVIDYYYLLKSNTNRTNDTNIQDTLRNLGLEKIAGAMMWVLNKILGLDEEYLIAPKNEKCGKVLLAEIIKGGNFGQSDAENQKATTAIQKNILRIKRDIRLMRYFPSECLWEPAFRIYHYFWRQFH